MDFPERAEKSPGGFGEASPDSERLVFQRVHEALSANRAEPADCNSLLLLFQVLLGVRAVVGNGEPQRNVLAFARTAFRGPDCAVHEVLVVLQERVLRDVRPFFRAHFECAVFSHPVLTDHFVLRSVVSVIVRPLVAFFQHQDRDFEHHVFLKSKYSVRCEDVVDFGRRERLALAWVDRVAL